MEILGFFSGEYIRGSLLIQWTAGNLHVHVLPSRFYLFNNLMVFFLAGVQSRQLQMNCAALEGASEYGKKMAGYKNMAEVKSDMDKNMSSQPQLQSA